MQPAGGRVFTGRPESRSCTTDDGQTVRPVRNEGAARERNLVGFDLGAVEDAQEECKVGPHAEEEPNMDCESDGGEDGERVRL